MNIKCIDNIKIYVMGNRETNKKEGEHGQYQKIRIKLLKLNLNNLS